MKKKNYRSVRLNPKEYTLFYPYFSNFHADLVDMKSEKAFSRDKRCSIMNLLTSDEIKWLIKDRVMEEVAVNRNDCIRDLTLSDESVTILEELMEETGLPTSTLIKRLIFIRHCGKSFKSAIKLSQRICIFCKDNAEVDSSCNEKSPSSIKKFKRKNRIKVAVSSEVIEKCGSNTVSKAFTRALRALTPQELRTMLLSAKDTYQPGRIERELYLSDKYIKYIEQTYSKTVNGSEKNSKRYQYSYVVSVLLLSRKEDSYV